MSLPQPGDSWQADHLVAAILVLTFAMVCKFAWGIQ
jgi:hypothetical protein